MTNKNTGFGRIYGLSEKEIQLIKAKDAKYQDGFQAGKLQAKKEFEKIIKKRIKENKDCDKTDTFEEQHDEHETIIAELEFLLLKLKEKK